MHLRRALLLASAWLFACSRIAAGDRDASAIDASPECVEGETRTCWEGPFAGDDGSELCGVGTSTCEAGVWGACASLSLWEPAPESALITGPTSCSRCEPACFVSTDEPGPADLTPGRSTGLSYDDTRGGVTLTPDRPTTPPLIDSDGDGVPDVADECEGDGAFRQADGSCYGSLFFFHTLPYLDPAVHDALPLSVQIRTADVYFLMDTTGSMGGELSRLARDLTSGTFISGCAGGIIGAIRCTIPDAWFGVGFHDDYPVSPFGAAAYGDVVYRNVLDVQSDVAGAQAAVNGLRLHYGNDGPESQTQALWAIATGQSLGGYLSARTCSGGRFGWPCFRPGTIPIVIHITDAPYHAGPGGAYPYRRPSIAGSRTYDEAVTALRAAAIRVITVQTCGSWRDDYCLEGEGHARTLGTDTGSIDSGAQPYVIRANADGSGLSTAIVDAVVSLANYSRMDITARAAGDTRGFTEGIAAISWGPRGSCARIDSGSRFVSCLPGTDVAFRVSFRNDAVMPTSAPQVFDFSIEVLGNGTSVLARVPVRIVVPALVAAYPAMGSYTRDHDGRATCGRSEAPTWTSLDFHADTPVGTRIEFELRAADTPEALGSATPVRIVVPTATSPADVRAALLAAGIPEGLHHLRVTAVLYANATRTSSPTLYDMALTWHCGPET